MGKQPRKSRRRARRPTPIDDELSILASVLAENRLDNNAFGWFSIPWRDGVNAAALAHRTALKIDPSEAHMDEIGVLIANSVYDQADRYELAGVWHQGIVLSRRNTDAAKLLATSARCIQLAISNSHGGGVVYNELLTQAFLAIEPALVEDLVLEYRCRDALGPNHNHQSERNERRRYAFTIAWRRGLYAAAYSIEPS